MSLNPNTIKSLLSLQCFEQLGLDFFYLNVKAVQKYLLQRSLVAKVQRRQLPDVGMLFLNLTVRREHLVSDSLNEVGMSVLVY